MNIIAMLLSMELLSLASDQATVSPTSKDCAAEIFAGGIVSDTGHEIFRGVFAPENDEFYFFRSLQGAENYGIFSSSKIGGSSWTTPERLTLGENHSDFYPALSPDGQVMVFSSYRPAPNDPSEKTNANFWKTQRTGDGWGEPEFLDVISSLPQYDNRAHFLNDGTIRFSSTSADWTETHEYVSQLSAEEYMPPALDSDREQFREWAHAQPELFVWTSDLSPDGLLAIIEVSTRNEDGRPGPSDLWYSRKLNNQWTAPKPIASGANTVEGNENFPTFSPDGKTMVFVRDFESFYTLPTSCVTRHPEAKK